LGFGTVVLIRIERVSLVILPANDLNELRDKARYAALEDGRVATYHVLIVDFGLIILMHHCNERAMRDVGVGKFAVRMLRKVIPKSSPGTNSSP
ncbi:hypothetical protein X777_08320, partial [Ooceraea biroi]